MCFYDDGSFDVLDDKEDFYNICLRPPEDKPNLKIPIDKLLSSIKELKKVIPHYKEVFKDKDEFSNFSSFIKEVFPIGFPTITYIRNLSSGKSRRVGIRPERIEGDFLTTDLNLPITKTLLFVGASRGAEISIDEVLVIGNSKECLEYEKEYKIRNRDTYSNRFDNFLDRLIDKELDSIFKETDEKLEEWRRFIDWLELFANYRVKGFRYIEVDFDGKAIIFLIPMKNEDEADEVLKIARSRKLASFNQNYSTNEWIFEFPKKETKKGERPKPTGDVSLGKYLKEIDRFYLSEENGRLGNIFLEKLDCEIEENDKKADKGKKQKNNKKNELNNKDQKIPEKITIEYLDSVYGESFSKAYGKNPFFIQLAYDIDENIEHEVKKQIRKKDKNLSKKEISEEEYKKELYTYVENEVLPKYRKNAFLAISERGTLSLTGRYKKAIKSLSNGESYSPRLIEWLFNITRARKTDEDEYVEITQWLNKDLNENQKDAIIKMLSAKDVFLLQGPPGTGKTTVIAEAIYQAVRKGMNVLLTSQSNDAVENALERCALVPELRLIRLDPRAKKDSNEEEVCNFGEDNVIFSYYESLLKSTERKIDINEKINQEIEELQKDKRQLEFLDRSDLQNEYSTKRQESEKLINEQNEIHDALKKIDEHNRLFIEDNENIKLLEKAINDSDSDVEFFLSEIQLNLIENDIKTFIQNMKDRGILLTSYQELTNNGKNKLLSLNIIEMKNVINLIDEIKEKQLSENESNIDVERLEEKKNAIDRKLESPEISEEDADKLHKEYISIAQEIREIKREKGDVFFISEKQKEIFAPFLLTMIEQKKEIQILETCKDLYEKTIGIIIQKLKDEISKREKLSDEEDKRKLKVLEGKIKDNDEEIKKIINDIKFNDKKLKDLAIKYGVSNVTNIIDEISKKIIIMENEKLKNKESAKIYDDFTPSLHKYKDKIISTLEEKSSNEKDKILPAYLTSCNVVGIPCTANQKALEENRFNDFDVVIVDEVSKATPPELLIPIIRGKKIVLVGDHRQLPPTFGEDEASYQEVVNQAEESDSEELKSMFSIENFKNFQNMVTSSIFKDYFEKADESIKATLFTQYRMHSDIMNVVNCFYENKLKCGVTEEKKSHGLVIKSLDGRDFIREEKHCYWIDSSKLPDGSLFYESKIGNSTSSCNFLEEEIIYEFLKKIAHEYRAKGYGKDKKITVGVISFYLQAIRNLRKGIKNLREDKNYKDDFSALDISINTVDRFQGQERNIVIVSLVRNRKITSHISFFERINVAFSRAQNLLCIVGAKELFDRVHVTFSSMDGEGEQTLNVYRNIIDKLKQQACFFYSDCLIDDEVMKKIKNEYNKNQELNQQKGKN